MNNSKLEIICMKIVVKVHQAVHQDLESYARSLNVESHRQVRIARHHLSTIVKYLQDKAG